MDLRLEAAALSEMAENTKADPDFRVPTVDWDRTAKDVLTLEWIDGTPLHDRATLEAKGFDLKHSVARRDPDLPAPRAARRLLPRRHASGKSVRRRRRQADRSSISASWAGSAPKERRFLAEILLRLHHPQLSAHRRGAFRGRLCAAASFGREFRAGDPRHRRADPQPRRRRDLDGEAADAAVRGHRPVRHADAAGAAAAAEDHGGGRGRGALARSQARHVDGGGAGGARMDRAPSRPGRPDRGRRAGRGDRRFLAGVPA